MNIDWSKAPEGATHYREDWHCTSTGGVQYYKQLAKGWRYWGELLGPGWRQCEEPIPGFKEIPRKGVKEWNGEDVPPVGTVCEWRAAGQRVWVPVTVVFSSHWVLVVRDVNDHPDGPVDIAIDVTQGTADKFRPIRTAEQIASEQRDEAALDIVDLIGWDRSSPEAKYAAERLYDAGYRKVAS